MHTVGFGLEQVPHDVEISDAVVAPRALADSRLSATISLHQRGYAGRKTTLTVRDGDKVLTSRPITLAADGSRPDRVAAIQRRRGGGENPEFFDRSAAG